MKRIVLILLVCVEGPRAGWKVFGERAVLKLFVEVSKRERPGEAERQCTRMDRAWRIGCVPGADEPTSCYDSESNYNDEVDFDCDCDFDLGRRLLPPPSLTSYFEVSYCGVTLTGVLYENTIRQFLGIFLK